MKVFSCFLKTTSSLWLVEIKDVSPTVGSNLALPRADPHPLFVWCNYRSELEALHSLGGEGRRGESCIKGAGTLVVSLRGLNFGLWSHLGCSGQNAIIFSRKGLA